MHGYDDVNRPPNNSANGPEKQGSGAAELFSETVGFLEWLRPGGPWLLTAILPDGPTTTITAQTASAIDSFLCEHNRKRNIYYSVNPAKGPMSKKAAKTDIAAVEYLLSDLDPRDDETPE